jgi:hypothetical protein
MADLRAAREHADGSSLQKKMEQIKQPPGDKSEDADEGKRAKKDGYALNLGYKIEVYLPVTKDIEVYNAIFKSLRENILAH